jgi:predicted O-methyltransferase YrrM
MPRMSRVPNPVLQAMYDTNEALDQTDAPVSLDSHLPELYAVALYDAVKRHAPVTVLEVGMAYGTATLAILTALNELPKPASRKLISLDPKQSSDWRGVAISNVRRCGLSHMHELLEEFDYLGLPTLLRRNVKLDFAYIDGWHTFDYVLLDLFYIDKMLRPGGIVAFNDCDWPAVEKVIGYLKTHRVYTELETGLPVSYNDGTRWGTLRRKLTHRPYVQPDRYFRKESMEEPTWDYFANF